jgi:hypothetical protein
MKAIKSATTAAALLALTIPAQASLLIGNLALDTQSTANAAYSATVWRAVGFTVGSSSTTLTDIGFELTATGGNPVVLLFNDSTGNPGSVLDTLSVSGSGTAWTATPSATTYPLAASTAYWVVVEGTASVSGNWYYSSTDTYTLNNGTTFGGTRVKNGANSWGLSSGGLGPNQYAGMNVNVVPEPHQYAMLAGLGLIGFAALRRKFSV